MHLSARFAAFLAGSLALVAGCPTAVCPPGTVAAGERCVLPDAGLDGATVVDGGGTNDGGAPLDAHVPCGGACSGASAQCLVTASSETCVACLDSTHCSDASAARCDTSTHACVACATSADCMHLTATPVCDTTGGGVCVGCLTNADCDASHACDPSTRSCVAITPASVSACGRCLRDSQCHAGQLCVPTSYYDPRLTTVTLVPVGTYCQWRQDATGTGAPNGDCFANARPYAGVSMLTSVDGTAAMMCTLSVSTCQAQADFATNDCMTLDAAGDDRCGLPGVDDGVCRNVGGSTNRCTLLCLTDNDCPSPSACNTSVSPPVCHF